MRDIERQGYDDAAPQHKVRIQFHFRMQRKA
jgi:hypothetical protein